MAKHTIVLIAVILVSMANISLAICCNTIKSQVMKKIEAKKILCAPGNTLPAKCCKDIATEVEKHVSAYKTLCLKHLTAACRSPKALGMQSGKIPNSAVTASSYHNGNYRPWFGRLNVKIRYCSWTSTSSGKKNSWFQVDLGKLTTVTGMATQGSCTHNEWATSYSISYSTDAKNWFFYQDSGQIKIFPANRDRTSVVTNSFQSAIQARFLRVWPQTWNSYPALRVEYYGCRH